METSECCWCSTEGHQTNKLPINKMVQLRMPETEQGPEVLSYYHSTACLAQFISKVATKMIQELGLD